MCYASFMFTEDAAEELIHYNDDKSCVNRATGTTGTIFFTKDRIINLPEKFGHAVDEAHSKSMKKRKVAALGYLQDYMDAVRHQPSKWKDQEYSHTTHDNWGSFVTYLG